jgi:hypothetical protein
MSTKNILIGGVVVVLLVLGLIFPRSGGTVIERVVGSVVGPDITSPYLSINGLEEWNYSVKLSQASTTLCSIVSPSATSTLIFGSVDITTGTTTVMTVEIGKGVANSEATTTLLDAKVLVPTTERQTIIASTTKNIIFSPNQRFNVKFGSASALTATVNSLSGYCKARFIKN